MASSGHHARRLLLVALIGASLAACERGTMRGDGAGRLQAQPAPRPSGEPAGRSGDTAGPETLARMPDNGEPDTGPPLEKPELFPGTGHFARQAPARVEVEEAEGGYTLNFADADIRKVVDAVLGEALGANYAVDPAVQGMVTARTARPLSRAQVIPALEDILAMNGAALIRAEGIYRVLPLEKAGTAPPVLAGDGRRGDRAFALHLIPLDYASAEAMQATLQPFLAPGRQLHADAARNLLLFRGPGSESRDLVAMVETLDVDWMAGMSFALLPLDNADAVNVVEELTEIFSREGDEPATSVVRFLPIERMNAVMVISEQPNYLRRAQIWTKRLDRGGSEETRQIYVYNVKNSRAADLAEVLGQLFDVSVAGGRGAGPEVAPGSRAGGLTSSGFGTGGFGTGGFGTGGFGGRSGVSTGGGRRQAAQGTTTGSAGAAATGSGDQGDGGASVQRAPGSRFGDGRSASPAFSRTAAGRAGGGFGGGALVEGPRIIADTRNNALLILANAQEYRMIESTVRRLDLVPLQVLIEATIAEVRLNDELRYGLRWFFQGETGSASQTVTFSELSNGAVTASFPGFSYLLEATDVRVALNALDEITNVNVVSSPQLMVLDNETARLQVGDQVPVPTQSAQSVTNPDAPIVNSIQYQDTGVILEVTPHVNANGLVVLEVRQEVSDVTETTSSEIDAPTIQQRQIDSSVAVQTGETIALGGLIRDSEEDSRSGVPLLMDIPLLGNLFSTDNQIAQRTELLVLLTPRVVRDQDEARDVTRELRRRLRGVRNLPQRLGRPDLIDEESGQGIASPPKPPAKEPAEDQ